MLKKFTIKLTNFTKNFYKIILPLTNHSKRYIVCIVIMFSPWNLLYFYLFWFAASNVFNMQAIIILYIWINCFFSVKNFKKIQLKTLAAYSLLGYLFSYKTFLNLKASMLITLNITLDIIRQVYIRTKEFVPNTVAKDFSARYQISYAADIGNSRNRVMYMQ